MMDESSADSRFSFVKEREAQPSRARSSWHLGDDSDTDPSGEMLGRKKKEVLEERNPQREASEYQAGQAARVFRLSFRKLGLLQVTDLSLLICLRQRTCQSVSCCQL